MFELFKKHKVKTNEQGENISNYRVELKKEYIRDVLKNKKLPIVLLDPLWHSMSDTIKTKFIKEKEAVLQELLKEQGRVSTDLKEYNVVKQNFLKQIIILSDEVQNGGDNKKLDELNKLHQSVLTANNKIEELETRLTEVGDEINQTNHAIIEEMVAVSYEYIEAYKKKEDELEKEIEALRSEMLNKTNEKKEAEKVQKNIYNYMHNMIGRQYVEVVDKEMMRK